MADENEDKSSKTEQPSERKLQKLREQGNVPRSREVNNFFMLLGITIVLMTTLPVSFAAALNIYGLFFTEAGMRTLASGQDIGIAMEIAAWEMLKMMFPTLIVFVVLALAGGFIQTGFLFSWKPVEPSLNKISIIKGFGRLFSVKSLAEFLKSLFKMIIVGAIMYFVFAMHENEVVVLVEKSLFATITTTQIILFRALLGVLAAAVLFALIDFVFQKQQFLKEQRMSLKELRDEMKESEGDPFVKSRQRQIRMERARQRMMQELPNADVVITNPTHYAVALKYKPEEGMTAPKCIAKGVDHLAMRIREVAQENNIPLYEDPPLARQLYKDVDIDDTIPLALFEAVAKVIAFVFEQRRKPRK